MSLQNNARRLKQIKKDLLRTITNLSAPRKLVFAMRAGVPKDEKKTQLTNDNLVLVTLWIAVRLSG
jgi:hypothetical protein